MFPVITIGCKSHIYMFPAVVLGLFENTISWVFIISRAISADETTRVGTWPKCKSIRGPYLLDSTLRERWGSPPSWWRLPITGNFGGDGGKLSLPLPSNWRSLNNKKGNRREKRKRANCVTPCSSCQNCCGSSDKKAISSFGSLHESCKLSSIL